MEVDAGFFRVCSMREVEGTGLSLGSGPLPGGTSTVMMELEEVHWSICEGGRVPLPKPPPPVNVAITKDLLKAWAFPLLAFAVQT